MTVIANFGMSNSFAPLNLTGLATLMPATMRIDYIRIYQDEDNEMVTCDPPGFPTTDYIAKHPEPYANPNMTLWYVSCSLFWKLRSTDLHAGNKPDTSGPRTLTLMVAKSSVSTQFRRSHSSLSSSFHIIT